MTMVNVLLTATPCFGQLIFPTGDVARPFSMLGLGDIVIPGIFVALALRFDMSRGCKKAYFNSAFAGYTTGLLVTILVMNWFQAAQVLPRHLNPMSSHISPQDRFI
jgi:minor histocompatibility antigen H13